MATCHTDTTRAVLYDRLALLYRVKQPDSAMFYVLKAQDVARRAGWKKGIARSNHQLGVLYFYRDELKTSLMYYEEALKDWEELLKQDDPAEVNVAAGGKAKTLSNIALIYQNLSDYRVAMRYYRKALSIDSSLNDQNAIARDKLNIGTVHKDLDEYDKALEMCLASLLIAEKNKNAELQAAILSGLGLIYLDIKDREKAIEYLKRSLRISLENGFIRNTINAYGNLGNVYKEKGQLNESESNYRQALAIAETNNDKRSAASLIGNIGSIYLLRANQEGIGDARAKTLLDSVITCFNKTHSMMVALNDEKGIATNLGNIGLLKHRMGKYKEAETHFIQALLISEKIGAIELKSSQELCLSQVYEAMGQHQEAYEYYKKHIRSMDSIVNERSHRSQLKAEMNFEYEKKEAVIIQHQLKEREQMQESSKRRTIIIIAVAACILIAFAFVFWIVRSLKTSRLQKRIIEEKQKEILDSITYARRIQRSMMPANAVLHKLLERVKNA